MTLSNAEALARRLHRLAAVQEQETALLIGRRGVADSGGDWIWWDGRLIPASPEACVFRRKPAGDSDPFQPVIPTEASH